MKDILERINERCDEFNLTFIGFANEKNEYINNRTKLILKCNKCGYQWDTSAFDKFVGKSGRKCPKCSGHYHYTEEELIEIINKRCKELDYTFLGYVGEHKRESKLILKCNKCGEMWNTTTAANLIRTDRNSHRCGRKNAASMPVHTNEKGMTKRIKKRLEGTSLLFVSYDENGYNGFKNTICVVKCKECGKIMKYRINALLYSEPKCKNCEYNGKIDNETAIRNIEEKCTLLGYEFLGFANDENRYNGKNTRLILKCLNCGYIWKSTTYFNFMHMVIKCRGCINSWHLEKEVRYILQKNNIKFEEQKKFEWLKYKISLSLDFYLPDYYSFIECQGRQHFMEVDKYGGAEGFENTKIRDKIKYDLCSKHNIRPIYYSLPKYGKNFMGEKLVCNEEKLLEKIYNNG